MGTSSNERGHHFGRHRMTLAAASGGVEEERRKARKGYERNSQEGMTMRDGDRHSKRRSGSAPTSKRLRREVAI